MFLYNCAFTSTHASRPHSLPASHTPHLLPTSHTLHYSPILTPLLPHPSLPSSHTLHRLFVHADVSEDTNISTLLVNLWTLAQKHNLLERRLLVSLSQQCHWGYPHSQTICHTVCVGCFLSMILSIMVAK